MRTKKMVRAALIAAIYVALCLIFAPISFGPIQVRISEALTLLVVLCPEAIAGVTIGCFISNLLASAPVDMVVGTLATFLATLATYKLRNIRWKGLPIIASLPPVIFNAVIIGLELTILYSPVHSSITVYLINMASVGIGQIVSCCFLGILLVRVIEKTPPLLNFFKTNKIS